MTALSRVTLASAGLSCTAVAGAALAIDKIGLRPSSLPFLFSSGRRQTSTSGPTTQPESQKSKTKISTKIFNMFNPMAQIFNRYKDAFYELVRLLVADITHSASSTDKNLMGPNG